MEMQQHSDKASLRWRSTAAGLLLAALIAAPIVIVATMANPPPREGFSAGAITPVAAVPNRIYPSLNDSGDVGSFAHGYLEFDADPSQPGGVPGFDSWPPVR